jgi:DNA polymerase III subunit epsilon
MWSSVKRYFGRANAIDSRRWVVLDVESSGLDPQRDALLAIAAIGVHFDAAGVPRIHLGDSFEAVLRPLQLDNPPDKANILLHGIGIGAQRAGSAPAQVLAGFEAWLGNSPLIGFHAGFDRAMLTRACDAAPQPRLASAWLDLEPLAAVLYPDVRGRTLDAWLRHFRIPCAMRHQAAADTLATAELLLALWPELRRQLAQPQFQKLVALAAQRRWLER